MDVDDAAVQRMVEESVEHAFEDLAARRWIEAALRAREALAATHKALAEAGEQLDAPDRAAIEAGAQAVEEALATEVEATKTGELARLQTAAAALDEVTRPLANRLMDQAVEAMLRKRGLI